MSVLASSDIPRIAHSSRLFSRSVYREKRTAAYIFEIVSVCFCALIKEGGKLRWNACAGMILLRNVDLMLLSAVFKLAIRNTNLLMSIAACIMHVKFAVYHRMDWFIEELFSPPMATIYSHNLSILSN